MKNDECRIGMKLAACFLACLLLAGCAGSGSKEQGVDLWLELETTQEVCGVSYEYTVAGQTLGGAVIMNADGSRMKAGSSVMLQFLPEDFPEGEIPDSFQVQMYLVDHRGVKTAVGSLVTLWRMMDDGRRFRLTGSEPEGYVLIRIK